MSVGTPANVTETIKLIVLHRAANPEVRVRIRTPSEEKGGRVVKTSQQRKAVAGTTFKITKQAEAASSSVCRPAYIGQPRFPTTKMQHTCGPSPPGICNTK